MYLISLFPCIIFIPLRLNSILYICFSALDRSLYYCLSIYCLLNYICNISAFLYFILHSFHFPLLIFPHPFNANLTPLSGTYSLLTFPFCSSPLSSFCIRSVIHLLYLHALLLESDPLLSKISCYLFLMLFYLSFYFASHCSTIIMIIYS